MVNMLSYGFENVSFPYKRNKCKNPASSVAKGCSRCRAWQKYHKSISTLAGMLAVVKYISRIWDFLHPSGCTVDDTGDLVPILQRHLYHVYLHHNGLCFFIRFFFSLCILFCQYSTVN